MTFSTAACGNDVAFVASSANTANLTGIEEATLTAAGAKITVTGAELDDLGRISSASGGIVEIVNMVNWTNTGMTDNGYVLWTFAGNQLWIDQDCTVNGV